MKDETDKISHLLEALDNSDKSVIRASVDSLIDIASRTPEVQQDLNRLLMDPSRKNRWSVAYILAHLPNPSRTCFEVLLDALDTQDPDIRWAVCLLLVRLGKGDRGIVTLLIDLLRKGNPSQRRMAVYCLRDLELKDRVSLQALLESLRDPDPLVRVATVTSLKVRHEVGKDGLDILLHLFLEDPDSRVRHAAAITLAQLGAPSDEIRLALQDASQSQDPQLKKAARAGLNLLKKKGPASTAK